MFSELLDHHRAFIARKGLPPTNDHDGVLRDIALDLSIQLKDVAQVRSDKMETTALGDVLATVLTIADHQPDLDLDATPLPPFYIADESTLTDVVGTYCAGVRQLGVAPEAAHATLREQTIRLAGWVSAAARRRKWDLGTLLTAAHLRQSHQAPQLA